jgi:N12 class adenine-specific DNA methylase
MVRKETNHLYTVLRSEIQGKPAALNNHCVTEYRAHLKTITKNLFKGISDTYKEYKSELSLKEWYQAFHNKNEQNLWTVVKFVYKDRFRSLERTKKAFIWYNDQIEENLIKVVSEIFARITDIEIDRTILSNCSGKPKNTVPIAENAENDTILEAEETEESNTSDAEMEHERIRYVLLLGSAFVNGKTRIYEYATSNRNNKKDFINFLKNEYGIGGRTLLNKHGLKREEHNGSGIKITWETEDGNEKNIKLSWTSVANEILKLIDSGEYLPESERPAASTQPAETGVPETVSTAEETKPESEAEAKETENIPQEGQGQEGQEGQEADVASPIDPGPTPEQKPRKPRRKKGNKDTGVYQISFFSTDFTTEPVSTQAETEEKPAATAEEKEDTQPKIIGTQAQSQMYTSENIIYGGIKTKAHDNIAAIKYLLSIENKNRQATKDEQNILAKYTGWGGIPQIFEDPVKPEWEKEQNALKSMLTEAEYSEARASTLNAFYTPATVIDFMYEALERMGFKGGRVLEPALGIGNFFGRYPEHLKANTTFTGIELDSITGRIAKQLYPDADIRVQGFEDAILEDDAYDLVISNVPFGQYSVYDPKYKNMGLPIHDYFFAKALDKVKPGGVVAFITSHFTMDKKDTTFRQYLSDRADLIGAVRLPNTTFKNIANTEVTTDIIFLRKKDGTTAIAGESWINTTEDNGIEYNEYFVNRPNNILGNLTTWTRMYGREDITVEESETPLKELLSGILGTFPENIIAAAEPKTTPAPVSVKAGSQAPDTLPADSSTKNYSYTVINGTVYQREDNILKKVPKKGKNTDRLKGMVGIRDKAKELIASMVQNLPDTTVQKLQKELNELYDKFVKKYGYLNSRTNKALFSEDPESPLLLSLEIIDEETETAHKAEIFQERTVRPAKKNLSAETASEALAISLNETASVNIPYISQLTSKTEKEVIEELQGQILYNPMEKRWELADEFLSGDVVCKLKSTEEGLSNAQTEEEKKNIAVSVEALRNCQPEPVSAEDIEVRIGATWIPSDVIKDFIAHIYGMTEDEKEDVIVEYIPSMSEWILDIGYRNRYSVKNRQTWGTARANGDSLIEKALNLKQPTIYDRDPMTKKQVFNKAETIAARAKQDIIKETFKNWIFDDPERRRRLEKIYNEKYNRYRLRTYNGDYLQFPGMNKAITLDVHQRNAVARGILGGNTLLDHAVGAGKTFTMTAIAMELKRLGIVNKSLFVVPNHLTEEWGREFLRLYPNAKILVCTQKDFKKENRKRLVARIATNDWDAVIISHSMFSKIPVSSQIMKQYIEEEISHIDKAISQIGGRYRFSRKVKILERHRKQLETKLQELYNAQNKDDVVSFEELGVDQLFVDEADEFKNLGARTKLNRIAGISQHTSQKAFDLFLKTRYISQLRNGKGGIVFATATPIANSMVELYTMQKYLQYGRLVETGLINFDSWASTFGEIISSLEIAPDGSGFRLKQRFCKFFNLPELLTMYWEFADVYTSDMLNLPVPKLKGDKPVNELTEPTPELKEFIQELVERSELVRKNIVSPKDDNMLLITNDGRKAALDIRIIEPTLPDNPLLKVNVAIQNIFEIWKNTKSEKSTQLVFCDLSTPSGATGFCIYDEIRDKLIQLGVPKEEIAYIHEATTEAQKSALYRKMRVGKVRILIGSTFKLGAGTNVQDRAIALHHIDAPWRPRDLEQREGRILRQGNKNKEVMIFRYVTKESFDAYMWQTLENKARFISQIRSGKTVSRTADDVDDTALSYAEVKALASGNPLILEKVKIDQEIQQLQILKSMYIRNRYRIQDDIARKKGFLENAKKFVDGAIKDIKRRNDNKKDTFEITINGKNFTDKKEAGKAIITEANKFVCNVKSLPDSFIHEKVEEIGEFNGFKVCLAFKNSITKLTDRPGLIVKGENEYRDEVAFVPSKNIITLERLLNSLDDEVAKREKAIEKTKSDLALLANELLKPFDKQKTLDALLRRQSELNVILDKDKPTELIGETEEDLAQ